MSIRINSVRNNNNNNNSTRKNGYYISREDFLSKIERDTALSNERRREHGLKEHGKFDFIVDFPYMKDSILVKCDKEYEWKIRDFCCGIDKSPQGFAELRSLIAEAVGLCDQYIQREVKMSRRERKEYFLMRQEILNTLGINPVYSPLHDRGGALPKVESYMKYIIAFYDKVWDDYTLYSKWWDLRKLFQDRY